MESQFGDAGKYSWFTETMVSANLMAAYGLGSKGRTNCQAQGWKEWEGGRGGMQAEDEQILGWAAIHLITSKNLKISKAFYLWHHFAL